MGDVEEALANALAFVRPLSSHCKENITCRVFLPAVISSLSNSSQVDELKSIVKTKTITYPPTIVSHNIGSSSDSLAEHVSEILFALATVAEDYRSIDNEPVAVSLSFSALSFPMFDNYRNFYKIFQSVSNSDFLLKQVLLLEKNRDLTNPSDWHDLQVVVMALATEICHNWLSVLRKVFLHHADRPAFSLREPRVAIMESMWGPVMRKSVGFLSSHDVCLFLLANKHHGRTYRQPLCQQQKLRISAIPISCQCETGDFRKIKKVFCPCSTLFTPRDWVRRLHHAPSNINDRVGRNAQRFMETLPECNKFGTARFRFTNDSDMPQGFCWDRGYV